MLRGIGCLSTKDAPKSHEQEKQTSIMCITLGHFGFQGFLGSALVLFLLQGSFIFCSF